MNINPGDRIAYIDFDGTAREGTVLMINQPVTIGDDNTEHDDSFEVVVLETAGEHRWCYPSQITNINGLDVAP